MAGETTTTNIAAVSQEIIDSIVQRSLKRSAILLPTVTDYTHLLKTGANGVKLPRTDNFTVQDKAAGVAGTNQDLTPTVDTISLDKYKHIPALIDDDVRPESHVNIEALYLRQMAAAMGRKMDDDILVALKNVATGVGLDEDGATLPDHVLNTNGALPITRDYILEMRKRLDLAEADEERCLLINPSQEAQMLAITDFIDASKYGSSTPIMNGEIGRVFGVKVVKSNVMTIDEWIMYTKEHVGFIRNINMKFEKQRAPLVSLADELSLSTKYGVAALQLGRLAVHAFDDGV